MVETRVNGVYDARQAAVSRPYAPRTRPDEERGPFLAWVSIALTPILWR